MPGLTLTRKKGEVLVIRVPGHRPIRVTMLGTPRINAALFNVQADNDIEVNRLELDQEKHSEDYES
jgi:sRNA-binding carbon storage regulator CsrA